MRPVNLIPPEERRGDRAPSRTGALPYVILGALAAAVLAVSATVLTGNQISDREADLANLEVREQEATARAQALQPYADFAAKALTREQTVQSLAQSRFDWERVMRELALVLPEDVWLTDLTGTVSPDVALESGADVQLRDSVPGPALAIIGCAASHQAVARFLETLKDIDGVTRVGIDADERSTDVDANAGGGAADCRTRSFISRFQVVAAFDAVPVPAVASSTPVPAATPTTASTTTDTGGVSEVRAQEERARDSAAEQTGEAKDAANLVPGVAR